VQLLFDALTPRGTGRFHPSLVDEGPPMAQLLTRAEAIGLMPGTILISC